MAEGDDSERTEEASQKKIEDARKKGDVPKSQEVSTWFLLAGGLLAFGMFGASSSRHLADSMTAFVSRPHAILVDGGAFQGLAFNIVLSIIAALGLPFLIIMIAAIAGHFIQHGVMWTVEPVKPKFSKISPLQGAKRMFSKQSLVTFVKGILKLGIVGVAIWMTVWPERNQLGLLPQLHLGALGGHLQDLIMQMFITTVVVLGILAAADFIYQRHAWFVKQRMSVRELKEEYKQMEGDPHIKARIRQIRMERSRKRMMAQVPDATVVITNPTHYAVALKYEPGMGAPQCVAKGVDVIAARIREVAQDNNVPLVENPPLARALYKQMEVDEFIPEEHYRAVAEIVGYVMRQKKG
jgi:flagellar biosynthesis protein FlhB